MPPTFQQAREALHLSSLNICADLGEDSTLLICDHRTSSWRCKMNPRGSLSSFWRIRWRPFTARHFLQLEHHFKPWGLL